MKSAGLAEGDGRPCGLSAGLGCTDSGNISEFGRVELTGASERACGNFSRKKSNKCGRKTSPSHDSAPDRTGATSATLTRSGATVSFAFFSLLSSLSKKKKINRQTHLRRSPKKLRAWDRSRAVRLRAVGSGRTPAPTCPPPQTEAPGRPCSGTTPGEQGGSLLKGAGTGRTAEPAP